MKAEELRVGNLVCRLNQTNILTVYSISKDGDIYFEELPDNPFDLYDDQGIEGVLLTPGILKVAGFVETRKTSGIFDKGILRIAVKISAAFIVQEEQVISLRILIDNLHQLQNLFHSLTGKELQINIKQLEQA